MTTIISLFGVAIALAEIGFAICKYTKETTRKRRSETLDVYNQVFFDTYALLELYSNTIGNKAILSDEIYQRPEIYKAVMNYLTKMESFAKGLEYEVYDFKTFVYLTPNELFEILSSFKDFIYKERKNKAYDLLFNDFVYLTDVMSLCVQAKLRGEKIKFKYAQMKKV